MISVSADSAHHLVRLRWVEINGGEVLDRADGLLSPQAALDLARNLVVHASGALGRMVKDAVAGDCPTCQTLRVIDVPRNDGARMETVNCPDCRDRYDRGQVPTIPAYVEDERRLLR